MGKRAILVEVQRLVEFRKSASQITLLNERLTALNCRAQLDIRGILQQLIVRIDRDPPGPSEGWVGPASGGMASKVRRGGSFLCAENYCRRYLPAARDENPPDSSASHTGFRCVRSPR